MFTAVASGVQAHSSTGRGRNANWDLLPFLMEMRLIHDRLRTDPALQDPAYEPPFSDFNLVVDNHGSAVNVTVPTATATIKFRYSATVDPQPVLDLVRDAAQRSGIALSEAREGDPPELDQNHPLVRLCSAIARAEPGVAAYGTDASELQTLAPCVILGAGGHCAGACTRRECLHSPTRNSGSAVHPAGAGDCAAKAVATIRVPVSNFRCRCELLGELKTLASPPAFGCARLDCSR